MDILSRKTLGYGVMASFAEPLELCELVPVSLPGGPFFRLSFFLWNVLCGPGGLVLSTAF